MKDNANDVFKSLLSNKKLNLSLGNSDHFEYERIPFGIPSLDNLT